MRRTLSILGLLLLSSTALAQVPPPPAATTGKQPSATPAPQDLLDRHRNSVARVACRGEVGVGFVVRDREHLITSRWLVRSGRTVSAVFGDGTRIDGMVVSLDDENDVALVKLDRPAPGTPLAMAAEASSVGDPIALIAPAYEWPPEQRAARNDWVVTRGHVAGVSDSFVKADIVLPDLSEGAPVVDDRGAVVGMVHHDGGVALLSPARAVRAMEQGAEPEAPYHGTLVPELHLGYQMHVPGERIVAHGFSWGLRWVAWDQLTLTQRFGAAFSGMVPRENTTLASQSYAGVNFDLEVGYRLLLTPPEMVPMHLTFGAGGTYQHQARVQRIARVVGQDVVFDELELEDDYLRPTFGVGLLTAGLLDLGYVFELDPKDVSSSGHRVTFEVTF